MKKFLKQNYDRHLIYTFLIFFFAIFKMNLKDAEWFGIIFLCALGGFALNFSREAYYEKFHESPFDIMDCIYGAIGGILAGVTYITFFR